MAHPKACYMLVGERYSGKLASARYVATLLHCSAQEGCTGCKRIMAGTDPDVLHISPNEKGTITIEMAHLLVESLSKHASRVGATRMVIIESAERMTIPAQNALLKVIEEPPANTIFMVLVTNTGGVLPTIQSRCQTIYIRPVAGLDPLARGRAGLMMEDIDLAIQKDIQVRAQQIGAASPFERMLLADKLATDPNRAEILDWLAYEVSQNIRQQNGTSQALQSVQNYFIYGSAGIAQKHALMELMIQL